MDPFIDIYNENHLIIFRKFGEVLRLWNFIYLCNIFFDVYVNCGCLTIHYKIFIIILSFVWVGLGWAHNFFTKEGKEKINIVQLTLF